MTKYDFPQLLNNRILVLDGAMGTEIQKLNLTEKDFRGGLFADSTRELKGNNDILVLTQPEIIKNIHRAYLNAGADIIETNSFNASSVSMSDYGLEGYVADINNTACNKTRFIVGRKLLCSLFCNSYGSLVYICHISFQPIIAHRN